MGSHMTASIRSPARLRKPSGKVLCGTIYSGMTCQGSAPQYQAEGRGMIWDSPSFESMKVESHDLESAGVYGGSQRAVHHPLNGMRPDRHTFYTAIAYTGPSQTMAYLG